jgi:hypothetical protein
MQRALNCSLRHQAHLLPYLLAPSQTRSPALAAEEEEWLARARRVLQFVFDPSQHVEALACDARASAQAETLMKCSLMQLTPQVSLHIRRNASGFAATCRTFVTSPC